MHSGHKFERAWDTLSPLSSVIILPFWAGVMTTVKVSLGLIGNCTACVLETQLDLDIAPGFLRLLLRDCSVNQ